MLLLNYINFNQRVFHFVSHTKIKATKWLNYSVRLLLYRVNVPIVVQFVVVPMCFNGFKVSGRTISEYFNTLLQMGVE